MRLENKAIERLLLLSRKINNAHQLTNKGDLLEIGLPKKNRIKLLLIGVVFLATPTILSYLIPSFEADKEFNAQLKLICYAMPFLLGIVAFLQSTKTVIDFNKETIKAKNQNIAFEDIVNFKIDRFKRRQLINFSIYLTSKNEKKILIGSTTDASIDRSEIENYALNLLELVKNK